MEAAIDVRGCTECWRRSVRVASAWSIAGKPSRYRVAPAPLAQRWSSGPLIRRLLGSSPSGAHQLVVPVIEKPSDDGRSLLLPTFDRERLRHRTFEHPRVRDRERGRSVACRRQPKRRRPPTHRRHRLGGTRPRASAALAGTVRGHEDPWATAPRRAVTRTSSNAVLTPCSARAHDGRSLAHEARTMSYLHERGSRCLRWKRSAKTAPTS